MKKRLHLVSLCLLLVAVLLCCTQPGSSTSTYTLSGSVASPPVTPTDGTFVYLKLVANGGAASAAALYWTRSPFAGGSASYSISGIAAGTYTGWAFVDMNHTAPDNSSALPTPGDYSTQNGQQITTESNQTQNVTNWMAD